jgi:hypothetical protein
MVVSGDNTMVGCYSNYFAFLRRYATDTNGGSVSLVSEHTFNHAVIVNTTAAYFSEVLAAKFDFSKMSINTEYYFAALKVKQYSDDAHVGTMLLLYSQSSGGLLQSTFMH